MADKTLSKDEILHLARLAKLELTEDEIEKYREQLGETIEYVKNLDELDTKNTPPTNSVVDLKNVTFEDGAENTQGLTVKEALSNSSKTKNNEFTVDRIMQ
jgi:aspartyl-tRNA(Asn)/glutamyl-tRNA(Gln) amidotransferase subunit C